MRSVDRIAAMLFSDVKGFSKIQDNELIARFSDIIHGDIQQFLTPENHFRVNSWGDAFYICSESAIALTEIALQMRDKFRIHNWGKDGLPNDLAVRIALHMQEVKVIYKDEGTEVADVVGRDVNLAARIEPITEPNAVFCSELFYMFIKDRHPKISGIYLGKKPLAKAFGELEMYELLWSHEMNPAVPVSGEADKLPSVFLSYAKEDRKTTFEIFEFLKSAGIDPWLDEEDLQPGDRWAERIEQSMRFSDFIIICFSKQMINKVGHIQVELKQALELSKRYPQNQPFVFPVRLDDCEIPDAFKQWQWLDWAKIEERERLITVIKGKRGLEKGQALQSKAANTQLASEFQRIKKAALEDYLKLLLEQYKAVNYEILTALDASRVPVMRIKIERFEAEIREVEKQLRELGV
jgi:class 3 adenylate cyclase